MTEIIANSPWALMAFALGAFTGLDVLIAYFARLGSRVSGVEKNLVGLRDEMRAEFAEVSKNLSRMGERVAKAEGRVDGWFEANNMHGDEKPENDE